TTSMAGTSIATTTTRRPNRASTGTSPVSRPSWWGRAKTASTASGCAHSAATFRSRPATRPSTDPIASPRPSSSPPTAGATSSVPNNDGSTSTGTPTNAGVAALVIAEGKAAAQRADIAAPLTANEVRQLVRATATPISSPCPSTEFCFAGPAGASFNIQYGYGR